MLIPTTTSITEVSEVKDGQVAVECTVCKKKFAVPADVMVNVKDDEAIICADCGQITDKNAAEASAASMKTSDAADTIKTALGK